MSVASRQFDCSDSHSACRRLRSDARDCGVTDPGNLPRLMLPPGATTAALLVHGFTATPWEMSPLAEFLAEAGIASLAIRLPGHGTSPEDLAARRYEEWLKSVAEGHRILSADFNSVFGMGMSTGCLLLLAAAPAACFEGLVLFSPYLRIRHRLAPYAGLIRWFQPYHLKYIGEDRQSRYYSHRPVAGIHQINRLVRVVRGQLGQITCPVIAFNGEGDQTIDIESAQELMDLLRSRVKIHERYGPDVPHVMTREENPCRWSMFAQATSFVQEIHRPGSPVRVK